MSDLTPEEKDLGIVYDYLPPEGHPQHVPEDKCPHCALCRIHARIVELEVALNALKKLYESRGEYIAELEAEVERWHQRDACGGNLTAARLAEERISTLEQGVRYEETRAAALLNRAEKAEAALAKCEAQKRGLATAAKTGMVAGNRVTEMEAEVEQAVERWQFVRDRMPTKWAAQMDDLAARYEERET